MIYKTLKNHESFINKVKNFDKNNIKNKDKKNRLAFSHKNFKTNEKRKISEALLIRSFKPTLNVQGMSTPLLLFD